MFPKNAWYVACTPADIDETPHRDERPRQLALRLALGKGRAARAPTRRSPASSWKASRTGRS